jgi:hypothetical protein
MSVETDEKFNSDIDVGNKLMKSTCRFVDIDELRIDNVASDTGPLPTPVFKLPSCAYCSNDSGNPNLTNQFQISR